MLPHKVVFLLMDTVLCARITFMLLVFMSVVSQPPPQKTNKQTAKLAFEY